MGTAACDSECRQVPVNRILRRNAYLRPWHVSDADRPYGGDVREGKKALAGRAGFKDWLGD